MEGGGEGGRQLKEKKQENHKGKEWKVERDRKD